MTKKEMKELKRNAKKAKKVAKKLGWKRILIILSIVVAILLGFCGFSYYKYQDPFYFFKPHEENNEPTTPPVVGDGNVFEHQFYGKNMSNKSSLLINGLTFSFPNTKYDETIKGIKLGSTGKPIKEDNPWIIETTFPSEATLLSYEIVLSNNNKGKTNYTVSTGSHTKSGECKEEQPTVYKEENLNLKTSNFKLSLTNTKGGYLKSLKLSFKDNSFKVSQDQTSFEAVVPGKNGVPNTYYAVISKEEYYKTIDFSQTGENLRKALNVRINQDTKYNSYNDAQTMLIYTDERVDRKGVLSSIYDGYDIKPEWNADIWNREHIWPCNKMWRKGYVTNSDDYRPDESTKDYRSDLHNLRVLTSQTNSSRSDKYYDIETTSTTFYPNISNVEGDDFRGDVARIIFYMALRYDDLKVVENPINGSTEMGKLSVLKEWAKLDPVDNFEIQRNNRIYEYQGNRNPFIDYPELVSKLYA